MKPVVIFYSQTGFTARYAHWIAQALSCPCVPFSERKSVDLKEYDTIVFGSWCHAGQVLKLKWLQKLQARLPEKRYAAFAVGASPMENPETAKSMAAVFPEGGPIRGFYLQGGLNYEKMRPANKVMMKIFASMIKKQAEKDQTKGEMAEMIGHSYDIADQKYIAPLLAYLKHGPNGNCNAGGKA